MAQARKANNQYWGIIYLQGLSTSFSRKGAYTETLLLTQESIDLSAKYNFVYEEYVSKLNMGLIYYYLENWDRSSKIYENCLEYFTEIKDSVQISKCYNNLGLIAEEYDIELAIQYFIKSAKIDRLLNKPYSENYVYNNIAFLYLKVKDYGEARKMYVKNLEQAKELNDPTLLVGAYVGLATVDLETRLTDKTFFYLKKP